jgi:hypothetical protein
MQEEAPGRVAQIKTAKQGCFSPAHITHTIPIFLPPPLPRHAQQYRPL